MRVLVRAIAKATGFFLQPVRQVRRFSFLEVRKEVDHDEEKGEIREGDEEIK